MSVPAVASLGASHHHAPLALLDRLAYQPAELPGALHRLVATAGVRSAVIVSTCNRIELYATFEGQPDPTRLARFLAEDRGIEPRELERVLMLRTGEATIRQLFRVAGGLDSMVRFESEIQAQLREAAQAASAAGTLDTELDRVFRDAQSAGRRVRREAAIDGPRRSLGRSAVDAGATALGDLGKRTVLVLGTGKIATLVVERVRELGSGLLVCSRDQQRASTLGGLEGRALDPGQLDRGLAQADLVIACTTAPRLMLDAERVARAAALRTAAGRTAPLVIIDLAVPRLVDPTARGTAGVLLLDLEDLGHVSLQDTDRLTVALHTGERIAQEETRRFMASAAGRQAAPIVAALRRSAEQLCERELQRTLVGRPSIDQEAASAALRRALAKLLHGPTVMLKEAAASGDRKQLVDLCRMFGLEASQLLDAPLAIAEPKMAIGTNAPRHGATNLHLDVEIADG